MIKPFRTGNENKLLYLLNAFANSVAKEDKCLPVRAALAALGKLRCTDKALFRRAVMYLSCLAVSNADDLIIQERVVTGMDERSRKHFNDLVDSLRDARIEEAQRKVNPIS